MRKITVLVMGLVWAGGGFAIGGAIELLALSLGFARLADRRNVLATRPDAQALPGDAAEDA